MAAVIASTQITMIMTIVFATLQQVPVANGTANPSSSSKCDVKLELAFEYLMSKDRLQWVTITSPQVRAESGAECVGIQYYYV